jgi:hypothetical protein
MLWRHMGEWDIALQFLTSALDGGEWSASHTGRFTPWEGALTTHWIVGWVGPRTDRHAVKTRKILHCRESNPERPPVARRYTNWAASARFKAE